jgi:hypothetical protein
MLFYNKQNFSASREKYFQLETALHFDLQNTKPDY